MPWVAVMQQRPFDRPYAAEQGAGDFLGNELPLVRLVESLGLDVTYWTDIDLDRHPERLLAHRALVSLGHDEYWSTRMRRGAEAGRARRVNLAFLGANAVYRHIRLRPSPPGPPTCSPTGWERFPLPGRGSDPACGCALTSRCCRSAPVTAAPTTPWAAPPAPTAG